MAPSGKTLEIVGQLQRSWSRNSGTCSKKPLRTMIEPQSMHDGASAWVAKATFVPPRLSVIPPPLVAFGAFRWHVHSNAHWHVHSKPRQPWRG
jgi:hypothetical protein